MIVSTGIDIVEVYRIRDSITRTPRFAERIFTSAERTYCESRGAASYQSYAARFAAKEAFFKALKTGWRGKLSWHDVEVVNDENGAPTLTISNEADRLMLEMGASKIHISLTHTREAAVAQVILERI
ncbi:MAG: holo-ACP synthase [Acidobacteria bacterium]|nr:holo-ACP synthase [Acidobacteriota bacterium]